MQLKSLKILCRRFWNGCDYLATTKRLPKPPKTHSAVVKLIRYALNPDKTTDEKCLYADSCNCSIVGAANQFKAVRDRWDKNSGNFAYHFIQSFKPGETSPEEAAHCGKELADALLGNAGFQVVIGTHLDKAHLHNHFVVNAVNPTDGKKLQTDHNFIRKMREENDRICRAHNLSVIENPESNGKTYAEWVIGKNGGFTWRGMIRQDIDELIPTVLTLKELLDALEQNGYTVRRRGKYLSLSPPGAKVNFRLYKLGKGYTEEDITERILYLDRRRAKAPGIKPIRIRVKAYHIKSSFPLKAKGGFRGLYYVYLYRLRKLLNVSAQVQRRIPIQARRDTKLFREFAEDARLLFENGIDNVNQLSEFYYAVDKKRNRLCAQRLSLREALSNCDSADTSKILQAQIAGLNTVIQNLGKQMQSCERIYERSNRVRVTNKQIDAIQKEMIQENVNPQNNSPLLKTPMNENERNDENVSRS